MSKNSSLKTRRGITYVAVAKTAFDKFWDFDKLRYCDALYDEDASVADEIFELVLECRKIGSVAFEAKYG